MFHRDETERLINLSRAQEKLEKGKYKRGLTAGKIGSYLAHDFIKYKRGEKKPNDLQYQTLQSHIAYFGKDMHELNAYLIELGFINGEEKHLFMKSLIDYATIFKKRIAAKEN